MTPELLLFLLRLLLALILYGFLGTVLVFLWRDLRASNGAPQHAPVAHLVMLDDDRPAGYIPLETTTDIGRGAGNIVQLDDETVSAQHARISYHGGQWWLEDLASRNGTIVNDLPLQEPIVITYGDEIHFGRVRARLASGPAPQSADLDADTEPPVDTAHN